jgi:FlaA1/EpsC-like NDP-sugar epimerase
MSTVGTADQKTSSIPFPVSKASEDARRFRDQFETAISAVERLADMAAVTSAAVFSSFIYRFLHVGKQLHYSADTVVIGALTFSLAFVLMLDHDGAYRRSNSLLRIRETERILRVSTQAFGVMFLISFLFLHPFSRWIVALSIIFVPLTLIIEKQFMYSLIRYLHSLGYGLQNLLIYGAGYTGRLVFSAVVRSPKLGLNPVGIIDDDEALNGQEIFEHGYRRERSIPVIRGPMTSDMIRAHKASLVMIGIPSLSRQRLQEVAAEAFAAGADVAFVPQLSFGLNSSTNYVDIDGVLVASLGQPSPKQLYETTKRIFDFFAALGLLIFTAPLWGILACYIRLDTDGPVFFRQTRVGHEGRPFELYKFRSMRADAPKYDFQPTLGRVAQ